VGRLTETEKIKLQKGKSISKLERAISNNAIDNYILQKVEIREKTQKQITFQKQKEEEKKQIAEVAEEIAKEIEKHLN